VEAVTTDGQGLASSDFQVVGSLFLTDVLAQIGVSSLDGGQVRVTRLSGPEAVWGYLATLKEDGSLSITSGAVP
jgi:hypothetical protein